MGYYTITIEQLDRLIDSLEAVRKTFSQSTMPQDAEAIARAKADVRSVRDRLVAEQYEVDRKRSDR